MKANKSFYLAGIIAGVLLLGVVGSFLYETYQAEQNASAVQKIVPIIDVEETLLIPTIAVVDVTAPHILVSDWDDELPSEIGKTITVTEPTVNNPNISISKQRVVIDDAAVNKMIARQTATDSTSIIDSEAEEVNGSENKLSLLAGNVWVMAQPAKNYTFQITGLSSKTLLKQYLSENGLPANTQIYQTQRNNKPWYVVLYGSFTSIEQANAAKLELSAAVQKDKPWLKQFAKIQRDL